jgi:hypothetical protein
MNTTTTREYRLADGLLLIVTLADEGVVFDLYNPALDEHVGTDAITADEVAERLAEEADEGAVANGPELVYSETAIVHYPASVDENGDVIVKWTARDVVNVIDTDLHLHDGFGGVVPFGEDNWPEGLSEDWQVMG